MGKGSKNRKPQPAPAPAPAQAAAPTSSPSVSVPAARGSQVRRIVLQFIAILGLSVALGLVFNAANPIGVRFAETSTPVEPHPKPLTSFDLLSTSSIAAKTPQPSPQPAPAPSAVAQQTPTSRPSVTIPLTPVAPTAVYALPPTVVSNLPPLPTPAAAAVAPTNPAQIHWRAAKPLAAGGHAVLVDVRPRPVYDAGHIPDAVSLPETSSPAEFTAFLKLLPTNTTLIVYCASTSCSQSKRVADRLVTEFHYAPVKYMTGGYQEYQQEELAKPQPPATPSPPQSQHEPRPSAAEETESMNRAMKKAREKLDVLVTTLTMTGDFVINDRASVKDGRVTVNLDIDLASQDAKSAFASRKLQNNTYPGFKRIYEETMREAGFSSVSVSVNTNPFKY
jgi:rhodanese-related sulfurtransferase